MPVTATWPLFQPVTPAAAAVEDAGEGLAPLERRGIITPFQRDRKNDFANATGVELIVSNVRQVLGTRATSAAGPGELPFNPGFGSLLYLLRHQKIDIVRKQQAIVYVVDALRKWEPRVIVTSVQVDDSVPRTLTIVTRFNIVDPNSSGRIVIAQNQSVETPISLLPLAA
jgi:phage baseplate assembly protein W